MYKRNWKVSQFVFIEIALKCLGGIGENEGIKITYQLT